MPQSFVTQYCFQIGSMVEMLLLSVALADKVNEYQRRSLTDSLAELSNRRSFDHHFAIEYERAARHGRALSLLMIDIDHFKRFNDTHGHQEGDVVLRGVARCLKKLSRATDLVCRYGGEEFALLLPETDEEGAMQIAERLRQGVDNGTFSKRHVSISIGIATYQGGQDPDANSLFAAADRALYTAKEQGRNRAVADLAAA